tara:strand:+ start:1 stop:1194 length:1194 start_codon:yes stop_codon:yes gene_type:complete
MISNKKRHFILYFLVSSLLCLSNEQQYVILVSFDGFRYDYVNRLETPNFDYIENNGIKAKSLQPIFPSFTFPNHYSIATGCYADKHGILGNEFSTFLGRYSYKDKKSVQDAKWYGAEPIWVTAEKNNVITATYFWVGSEAKIGGYYPTYFKYYQNGIDPKDKVKQVIEWLELPLDERPKLVCLYFNEPDHAGHVYGADSKEVNDQIKASDYILGYLMNSLKQLDIYDNINIIIVSDHGMVDVSEERVINIDDFNLPGTIEGRGPIMNYKINSDDLDKILDINIPHVQLKSSIKNNQLHYHNPFYDFLLIADEGWMMYSNKDIEKYNGKLPVKGMHGYDASSMNMHAIFYAYGPKFKSGFAIDTFELIHVYPILCELLGIKPYENIDGSLKVLQPILK